MCLFEGLTRRMPAFNFLQFAFQNACSKVDLFSIEQDIIKKINKLKEKQN
jgi:hypothetical protein